jgi:hypothetical protein
MYNQKVDRFIVKAYLLDSNGDQSMDLSGYVTSVNVKKDFIANCLPLYVLNLRIEKSLRDTIRDLKSDISLGVYSYAIDPTVSNDETSPTSNAMEDTIVETILTPYDKALTTNVQSQDSDDDADSTESSSKTQNIKVDYELDCIPKDLLAINNSVINEVYENASMNDIAVSILSGVIPSGNSLVMQPSDNIDREESLIIPPMNVVPAMRFLQNQYGFYNNSMSVFFDTGKTYLFDPMANSDTVHARMFEIITKKASEVTDENLFSNIQVDKDTENTRIYRKNDPAVGTVTDVFMDSVGQTSIISSYDDDLNGIRREYDNNTDNGKVRYIWNNLQKDIFEKSLIHNSTKATRISLASINPNYFTPDTSVLITASLDSISGYYTISEESYSISTTDFKTYTISIVLSMSKVV